MVYKYLLYVINLNKDYDYLVLWFSSAWCSLEVLLLKYTTGFLHRRKLRSGTVNLDANS